MNKKLLITFLIVIFIGLLAGVYFVFFDGSDTPEEIVGTPDFPMLDDEVGNQEMNQGNNNVDEDGMDTPTFPQTGQERFRSIAQNVVSFSTQGTVATTSDVVFVGRETGNVFEVDLEEDETTRLSNTTIPRIQDGKLSATGTSVALRYFNESFSSVRTFLAALVINEEEEDVDFKLEGEFVPDEVLAYDFSPEDERFFYLTPTDSGVEGIVVNLVDQTSERVFVSKIRGWQVVWFSPNQILFLTNPSSNAEGFAYIYTLSNGSFEKIVGDREGLTVMISDDGERVVFSETQGREVATHSLNLSSGEVRMLPVSTFAEKCVWSEENTAILYCAVPQSITSSNLPDAWYRGDTSFNDRIWRINVEGGTSGLLVNPEEFEVGPIDAIDLQLTDEEEYLLLRNKRDDTLWNIAL